MTHMMPRRAAYLVYSASVALYLSACNGDSVTRYPSRGGLRNQPGNCVIGKLNDAWSSARLSGQQTLPVKCPYQVTVENQSITFAAELFGPKATTSLNGSATLGPVRSTLEFFTVIPSQTQYWGDDPNNSDGRRLVFTANYLAGHIPAGGPGPYAHDSGTVIVDGTYYGQAQAFVTTSGSAEVAPGYLIVPSSIIAGDPYPFRAVTDVDTNAYDFAWSVDGTNVGNNDADFATAFATAGTHQVTAYATNTGGGVQTLSAMFTVALNAIITGNVSAKSGGSVTYGAVISGGTAPYSYRWYRDGSQVSTASTYRYTFGTQCTAQLQLDVTDAAGNSGSVAEDLYLIDPSC